MSWIAIVAALAAQGTSPAAPAASPPAAWVQGEWVPLAEESEGRVDLDVSALRRDGDKVRVRVRADLPAAPAGARWGIAEYELDCRAGTHRELGWTEYGLDGALRRRSDQAAAAGSAASTEGGRARIVQVCGRAGWRAEGAE